MPLYFADECVAQLVIDGLRQRGLDVADAKQICQGDDDERVLALAAATGRVVVTDDWGFGELTVRQGEPAVGVIILSLFAMSAGARESYAVERICDLGDQAIGHLSIIEPGRTRLRQLRLI